MSFAHDNDDDDDVKHVNKIPNMLWMQMHTTLSRWLYDERTKIEHPIHYKFDAHGSMAYGCIATTTTTITHWERIRKLYLFKCQMLIFLSFCVLLIFVSQVCLAFFFIWRLLCCRCPHHLFRLSNVSAHCAIVQSQNTSFTHHTRTGTHRMINKFISKTVQFVLIL